MTQCRLHRLVRIKISRHSRLVLSLVMCSLVLLVSSCSSPLAQSSQTPNSPISAEQKMVKVIYPSLRLAANGSVALLDTNNQGFKVYTVPELDLRFSQDSNENVVDVVLSSSGTSVGVQTALDELLLVTSSQRHSYKLPRSRDRIRTLAISDAGDKLAILAVHDLPHSEINPKDNGVLEIWSLPPEDKPKASIKLPLFDSAVLSANGAFSTFAVHSTTNIGNNQFMAVYKSVERDGGLSPLWIEQEPSLNRSAVALYNDWVWTVQADAIIGWQKEAPPVTLPGTLREHLVFSPTGSHLLAYRGEEGDDITSTKILFRLFELSSLEKIKQVTHVIKDEMNAHCTLSKSLSLLELRATRDGEIKTKELGWKVH